MENVNYIVYDLDVWGNPDAGWDVNTWTEIARITVGFWGDDVEYNRQAILNALYEKEIICTKDLEKFDVVDMCNGSVEIYAAHDGMPLFTLEEYKEDN